MVLSVGVKFYKLPSISFTSPGFLRFAMTQDMVWINFLVSDSKFYYMGEAKIKFSNLAFKHIGDTLSSNLLSSNLMDIL